MSPIFDTAPIVITSKELDEPDRRDEILRQISVISVAAQFDFPPELSVAIALGMVEVTEGVEQAETTV